MDLSRSKDIAKKIEHWSRSGSLELYNEANERKVSISALLEELDPTPRDNRGTPEWPLDAFERQLMLFGIRSAEYNSISVQQFFSCRCVFVGVVNSLRQCLVLIRPPIFGGHNLKFVKIFVFFYSHLLRLL